MDHAPFIWSAYALSAAVLAWNALAPLKRKRRALERLRWIARQEEADDAHP